MADGIPREALDGATHMIRELRQRAEQAEARVAELAAALLGQVDQMDRLASAFQMLGKEEVRERLALAHFDMARCLEAIRNRVSAVLALAPAAAAERVAAMEAVCEAARRWWVGSGSEREVSAALARLDAAGGDGDG